MIKTLVTLMRGSAAASAEELADRHALLILDQQMRDSRASLGRSQRALAVALAEDAREVQRAGSLTQRIAGLEDRARAALAADREDLAAEAAETIAALEIEHDTAAQARTLFAAEIARLRRHVAEAERRLAALHRGRRLARMAEAVRQSRRGRIETPDLHECTLSEAEATLTRLRERQQDLACAEEVLDRPQSVEQRLAEAGFGQGHPTGASVLARLKQA
jgi:phage shock protein A